MNRLETRSLGNTGLKVSVISLGSGRLLRPNFSGAIRKRAALIGEAVALGINFFDTADAYAFGWDERVLGMATQRLKDKTIIASKVGYPATFLAKLSKKLSGQATQNFSRNYIYQECERSLRLLRRDALDLYYLHSPPSDQITAGMEVISTLKQDGKIRFSGISFERTSDFLSLPANVVDVVQIPLPPNPAELDQAIGKCLSEGLGCVVRQPFHYRKQWLADDQQLASQPPEGFLKALAAKYPASTFLFSTQNRENLQRNCSLFTQPIRSGWQR